MRQEAEERKPDQSQFELKRVKMKSLGLLLFIAALSVASYAPIEITVEEMPKPHSMPEKGEAETSYVPHPSKRHRQLRGAPRHDPRDGRAPPPEMWFEQRLDHFRPTDGRTWRQRFWVSEEFRRPGGPAFLMIGGEGPENPVWMVAGTWTEYAKAFGATMFLLEHR